MIAEASQRFGVPAHWIRAVMQAESTGDTGALSPKSAMGLMQVMPETYAELRLRYHLGADPYEPRNNILAGAAYLREMHDRFGPDGFLAAYNAGPGRYDDYLKRGRLLPEETRNYVAALAPVIGVPGVPYHSDGASTASQLTTSGAAHDGGEQPESAKQEQIHDSNIAIRRSPKRTDQDALRDRPGCIRANFGQRTNDRHDRTRTAAKSRIDRDFDCSRQFAHSYFNRTAIVVGSEQ